jgi:hypothetical protein
MGIFGKKEAMEFDKNQDVAIQNIQKQINDLTAAYNSLSKNCETWFKYLNGTFFPKFNALAKRVADGEKLDAQQQAALDGLVKTAISIQEATKATEKTES